MLRHRVFGRRHRGLLCAALGALLLLPTGVAAAAPESGAFVLTAPPPPEDPALLAEVGVLPDRLKRTSVPGDVVNTETVEVALGAGGAVSQVHLVQTLTLTGEGDYVVRERGPARQAVSLDGSTPPVTKLGTVVWSGFVPGHRELAARLTLDAGLESRRLPLTVTLTFSPADGGPSRALPLGGALPGPGRVEVTVTNTSAGQVQVPTGTVPAADAAPVLDVMLAAADAPGPRPPVAGYGLPLSLPARGPVGATVLAPVVPLALSGTVLALGPGDEAAGTLEGPTVTAVPGGGSVDGVLEAAVTFTLTVPATGARVALDLTAVPALDRRTLAPPAGSATWAAWAGTGPDAQAQQAASATLALVAAQGARAASFSPYLGADLPGTVSTAFALSLDSPAAVAVVAAPLQPRRGAIALVLLAAAAVGGNAVALWRLA